MSSITLYIENQRETEEAKILLKFTAASLNGRPRIYCKMNWGPQKFTGASAPMIHILCVRVEEHGLSSTLCVVQTVFLHMPNCRATDLMMQLVVFCNNCTA